MSNLDLLAAKCTADVMQSRCLSMTSPIPSPPLIGFTPMHSNILIAETQHVAIQHSRQSDLVRRDGELNANHDDDYLPPLPPPLRSPHTYSNPSTSLRRIRPIEQDSLGDEDGLISGSDDGLFSEDDDGLFSEDENNFDIVLSHPQFVPAPFPSLDHLRQALKLQALSFGFALVTRQSNSVLGFAIFHCSRGGQHRTGMGSDYEQIRKRDPRSHRQACPFTLQARRTSSSPESWTISTVNNAHNHIRETPRNLSALRSLTMTAEARDYINAQLDKRIKPTQLLLTLRELYPEVVLAAQDISNLGYRRRVALRVGHTTTEACLNKLRDRDELYKPFLNERRQLIGLVYTTPTARALLHRFPTVLFMDCTYKTNRYRMPMLHIAGFTSTNQTYTAGIAFLTRETTAWYTVALQAFLNLVDPGRQLKIKVIITDREKALHHAIDQLLPGIYRLSCVWHLGENVKANCRISFIGLEDWKLKLSEFRKRWMTTVVPATTEAAMNDALGALDSEYSDPRYLPARDYIRSLCTIKERFVYAWADQHLHLGQHSNSRLEGGHRLIKDIIATHHGDLYDVLDAVRDYLQLQWDAIKTRIGAERIHPYTYVPAVLESVRFSACRLLPVGLC